MGAGLTSSPLFSLSNPVQDQWLNAAPGLDITPEQNTTGDAGRQGSVVEEKETTTMQSTVDTA
jgi:hypothetical protein